MRRKKFCAGDFGNKAAHILTQPLAVARVAFFILFYLNPLSGRREKYYVENFRNKKIRCRL